MPILVPQALPPSPIPPHPRVPLMPCAARAPAPRAPALVTACLPLTAAPRSGQPRHVTCLWYHPPTRAPSLHTAEMLPWAQNRSAIALRLPHLGPLGLHPTLTLQQQQPPQNSSASVHLTPPPPTRSSVSMGACTMSAQWRRMARRWSSVNALYACAEGCDTGSRRRVDHDTK